MPKIAREECLKLLPADAGAQGIATALRRTPRFLPRDSRVCLCPACGARVGILYRPPLKTIYHHHFGFPVLDYADDWKCARCYGLVYRSDQMKGTRAAMRLARTRDWEEFLVRHPEWRNCESSQWLYREQAFVEYQKVRHRHWNRKKWQSRTDSGKTASG